MGSTGLAIFMCDDREEVEARLAPANVINSVDRSMVDCFSLQTNDVGDCTAMLVALLYLNLED